jgi:type IV pilus assembly protein PilY1
MQEDVMKTIRPASSIVRAVFASMRTLVFVGSALCASFGAQAGVTDISTAPLETSSTTSVLPNLMFVLDDSGSMDWDFLPDWANDNYCRTTTGTFTGACCRDASSANGSGSGNNTCWTNSGVVANPWGNWRGHAPFMNSDFNTVYYNPSVTYTPPLNADGTSKPSQTTYTSVKDDYYGIQQTTSVNLLTQFPDTEWCVDNTYTDCLRNGNYILPGTVNSKNYTTYHPVLATGSGTKVSGTPSAPTTSTQSWGPHYYAILPGEYCDNMNLRNCQTTQTATFSFPSRLRWCSSTANAAASSPASGSCQAVKTSTYQYPRYPNVFFSAGTAGTAAVPAVAATSSFTITLSGCTSTKKVAISAVTVNSVNILASTTALESSNTTLAADLRAAITGSGYSASGSGSGVTITAPVASGNINFAVSLTRAGTSNAACVITLNPTTPSFSGYAAAIPAVPAVPASYPGSFVRVDIVPGTTSYTAPGSATKATTRTDCAGATCTYSEEMTNFANWWTYYHSRMQMMKSATSIAFGPIGTRYRVGYFTINNSTSAANALSIGTFDATQKTAWYSKLVAANPSGSTPLRAALTRAGRIFAGQLNASTGGADPMQYSCQQNFTILSTDGYWSNDPGGFKINGTTAIGDEDAALVRPQLDGTGSVGTLADTAAYYYNTDLRTSALNNCTGSIVSPATVGNNVCANNVPTSGLDAAAHQHMTTFTVGLGIAGYMQYSPSYLTATSGDYFNVKNGTTVNVANGICTWQASGTCNWPVPGDNLQSNIDDLWHAAVNGYGTYFSAGNPAALSSGLSDALAGVSARTGDSAAATTSNPNIVTGDNFLFSSTYTSVDWYGELNRQQIDLTTGAVSATKDWSAQTLLDTNSARVIYTYDPTGAASHLKSFDWASLTAGERAFFSSPAIDTLSQFCSIGATCISAASKTLAAGSNLVSYLTGDRTNEGASSDISKYYNQRTHLLGDIVSSEAVYIKVPPYSYVDSGYDSFKSGNAARTGMTYVAANDGMLHAFNASTGAESWAFVPSMVLPNLYKLADKNYATQHTYQVDGTPNQGDIYAGGSWHSIIVGGLNGGGRGYYALDVTDPANPKALWEFTSDTSKGTGYTTDANLGYTYGKPEITKLKNGTWVVMVTSGYNNVPDSRYAYGNGGGYLYILNAYTGALIRTIATGAGNAATPSGLAQIRAWTDDGMANNTAQRVYGGDMLGNLWRFDVNGDIGNAGYDAQVLATLRDSSGNIQPMTAKPELGDVNGTAVVYVGTGRYLGVSDLGDTHQQTIYGIKDPLTTASYTNPRSLPTFVNQSLTSTTCPSGSPVTICTAGQLVRTTSNNTVNFATQDGWYVDLPDSGERANTDPQLSLGTLAFTTNIPDTSACTVGGYSYFYFFDYRTGGQVSTSTTGVVGKKLGNALATRPVFARLPNNKVIGIVRMSDGTTVVPNVPIGNAASATRRLSWRELSTDR